MDLLLLEDRVGVLHTARNITGDDDRWCIG
jgi:hypothetical protein